jgi:hypothetical protein
MAQKRPVMQSEKHIETQIKRTKVHPHQEENPRKKAARAPESHLRNRGAKPTQRPLKGHSNYTNGNQLNKLKNRRNQMRQQPEIQYSGNVIKPLNS